MRIEAQPQDDPTATGSEAATVLVSFELSQSKWVLTVRAPGSAKLSRLTVPARDTEKVLSLLTTQRQQVERRTGRPVRIMSIYEAAWLGGEAGVCSMVVPPSVAQEDIRRLSRESGELVAERTKLSNRVGGLLANQGVAGFKPLKKGARQVLQTLRTGDGRELPPHLRIAIERILQRLELLSNQIKAAEAERDALLRAARVDAAPDRAPEAATAASPEMAAAPLLLRLRGIGPEFSTMLPLECLNRKFDNRRQVGAFAGLAPTPWASGSVEREQGISKAGNRRLRTALIELAWSWQRHQPDSTLTQWFHKRIKGQSGRVKRIAIVALARKLLVALWRYVKHGVVPQGAVLKAA